MEIIWDRICREDWAEATAAEILPMQQHWTYGDVLSALGRQVRRGEVMHGGRRVGLVQVIGRRFGPLQLSLIGRGPLWLDGLPAVKRAMACRMIARGAGVMVMTPEQGLSGRGLIPLVSHRHQAMLYLRPDRLTIRARFAGKWRNRLVRAEGMDISVRQGVPSQRELDDLLVLDAAQQRARGYRALPACFTRAWAHVDPNALRLYRAIHEGRVIAMMLMLLHRPTAGYHIGWSGNDGRRLNAHQFLLWHVIRDLQGGGYTALDLGDVNVDGAPGLARFKTGTGAIVAPLGATMLVLPTFIRPRS